MSKSYKVAKKTINMGQKKGQTLFSLDLTVTEP